MSISKFESAARKLQELNLGSLVYLRSNKKCPVFVKKLPEEVGPILGMGGCEDLCTVAEYAERFALPPPKSISSNIKQGVITRGLVAPELFGDGWDAGMLAPKSE